MIEFENEPDYLKTAFIVEKGIASGVDFLIKYYDDRMSIWSVYSIGIIKEDEMQTYYPHYDRRHNINILFSYSLDKRKTWDVNLRWNYGSGFPFTKTQAYYEEINFDNGANTSIDNANGSLGILYSDLNTGRLPDYHRLDLSFKKTYKFTEFNVLECSFGVTNLYNRNNIFLLR